MSYIIYYNKTYCLGFTSNKIHRIYIYIFVDNLSTVDFQKCTSTTEDFDATRVNQIIVNPKCKIY